jgi:hypothetical protein
MSDKVFDGVKFMMERTVHETHLKLHEFYTGTESGTNGMRRIVVLEKEGSMVNK